MPGSPARSETVAPALPRATFPHLRVDVGVAGAITVEVVAGGAVRVRAEYDPTFMSVLDFENVFARMEAMAVRYESPALRGAADAHARPAVTLVD